MSLRVTSPAHLLPNNTLPPRHMEVRSTYGTGVAPKSWAPSDGQRENAGLTGTYCPPAPVPTQYTLGSTWGLRLGYTRKDWQHYCTMSCFCSRLFASQCYEWSRCRAGSTMIVYKVSTGLEGRRVCATPFCSEVLLSQACMTGL